MSHWSLVEKILPLIIFAEMAWWLQPIPSLSQVRSQTPPQRTQNFYIYFRVFGVVLICQERYLSVSKCHLYMSELIGGFLEISKGSVHAGWSWAGAVRQFGKIFWFFPPDFNETWKSLTLIIFLIFSVCQRYIKSHSLSWSPCKTSQELRMLSSVTINCQITKIVMNSGSQLSEL